MLMIRLIIRLIYRERESDEVEGTDTQITTTSDPASFQLREGLDYRIANER
jgi:hypothetical protein